MAFLAQRHTQEKIYQRVLKKSAFWCLTTFFVSMEAGVLEAMPDFRRANSSPALEISTFSTRSQWLNRQAKTLNVQVTLFPDSARQEKEWLYLPVSVDGAANAYERASKLQDLEDSWNEQEPRPEPQIFLMPAGRK